MSGWFIDGVDYRAVISLLSWRDASTVTEVKSTIKVCSLIMVLVREGMVKYK